MAEALGMSDLADRSLVDATAVPEMSGRVVEMFGQSSWRVVDGRQRIWNRG